MSEINKEHIQTQVSGHVLEITFNRPAKLNAFTPDMYHSLARAYHQLENDPKLRCGLLRANGEHFTSGLELNLWSGIFSEGSLPKLAQDEIDPFGLTGPRLSKPIVMAATGLCYTVGLELMLNTDIRVATPKARFAQIEVKRGIYPVGGATIRLQREIGWANAQRYLMTGDEISGSEAYRLGLIQELVEPEELEAKARELTQKISKAAPLGVQASLRSSRRAWLQGEEFETHNLLPEMVPLMATEDVQEGIKSFLERRDAEFKGK